LNYIIGAGGGGSWLCPSLCLLVGKENVTVIDGDTLEEKNLNRQLYSADQVGQFKAEALANKYGCDWRNDWYYTGLLNLDARDWLLVCVDNMPARKAALESCDFYKSRAIFAANEVTSAEAYLYDPKWIDGGLDPRKYYPEILSEKSGDPRAAAIGCTGAAQVATRQLVSANFMSAALVQHIYVAWALEGETLSAEARQHLPHRLIANLSRLQTLSPHGEKIKEQANDTSRNT
jgi:molybdopterin/thiamine biosynthesis adenylyltransferase